MASGAPSTGAVQDARAMALPAALDLRSCFDLTGRAALVTGAASGLGRAVAWGLACFGADVVACDLDAAATEETARAIERGTGRRAVGLAADVTDPGDVERAVAAPLGAFGRIDVCVNSAGINRRAPALELSGAEFRQVLEVNVVGTFMCATTAGRVMVERGHGKVINMASVLGRTGLPRQSAYAASKGAVIQLTKVLALEWAPHGVQVNALAPAHHATPLTDQLPRELRDEAIARIPQGRFAAAHEIVAPAVFLASAASDFMTGSTVDFDGGWCAA